MAIGMAGMGVFFDVLPYFYFYSQGYKGKPY